MLVFESIEQTEVDEPRLKTLTSMDLMFAENLTMQLEGLTMVDSMQLEVTSAGSAAVS